MSALLKTMGALPIAAVALLTAGCGIYERGLKRDNAREQDHNRTLTKAAIIMKAVKAWSATHGGQLPSPEQFRSEVKPVLPTPNGFNLTESELQSAFQSFQWNFAGGRVDASKAAEMEVGRLDDAQGGAIGYASGEVRRGDGK
ncbi:hypothetical protein EON81_07350 [bacterium]|nr:MAG: hypothetical protein EON81_07350 [bacterium]